MRFVLDNSVSMRWLFGDGSDEDLAYASRVLAELEQAGAQALVPAIWALEAGNVIVRAESRGLLPESRSAAFLRLLRAMAIHIDAASADRALTDTLQLARRHALSTYDAAYLELALREEVPLASLDVDLRAAAIRAGVGLMGVSV